MRRRTCCPIMRRSSSRSRDLARGARAVPGARPLRVSERGHVRAALARDARGDVDAADVGGRATAAPARPYFDEMLERPRARARAVRGRRSGVRSTTSRSPSRRRRACTSSSSGLGLGPGDEVVTTDAEHFGLTGPLVASGATLRVAKVRERAGRGRLRPDRARGHAAHAADRDVGRLVDRRQGVPVACAARRDAGARCWSTARRASARSTVDAPAPTSTR